MKLPLIIVTFFVAFCFITGCGSKEEKTVSADNGSVAQSVSDTIFPFKASFDVTAKEKSINFAEADSELTGSPTIKSYVIESEEWANNLPSIVGRIVEVETINGISKIKAIHQRIVATEVKVEPKVPENSLLKQDKYNRERAAELSFLGISAGINEKQVYDYKETMAFFGKIEDEDVDQKKIADTFRCSDPQNCKYFYVNSASVRICESMRLEEKGRKIKATEIPTGGVAIPIGVNLYTGTTQSNYVRKSLVFCTVLGIPPKP